MEQVIGYVRVSTETQVKKGQGLEAQKEEIRKFCKKNKLDLVHIYHDDGVSGTEEERDDLDIVLNLLGTYKKVVVLNTNRLWRNDFTKVEIKREFIKNKAEIVSVEQSNYSVYDKDPNDFLVNTIMEALDQYDRMVISKKLARGRKTKVKTDGVKGCGEVPLGYKWQHEGVDKPVVVVDDEYSWLVKEIFKKYLELKSIRKVQKWLKDNEITTRRGNDYSAAGLQKILKNPFYTGKIIWGEDVYSGSHDPLINKVTFGKVNSMLKNNRKSS